MTHCSTRCTVNVSIVSFMCHYDRHDTLLKHFALYPEHEHPTSQQRSLKLQIMLGTMIAECATLEIFSGASEVHEYIYIFSD